MQNLKYEVEAIQISIYCDIIRQILRNHEELSLSKILVFSYLIKNDYFLLSNVYKANSSQNIIYKGLSLLAGNYKDFCESVEYIMKAVHLLINCGAVIIENTILKFVSTAEPPKMVYQESPFLENTIEASKKMTDKQFVKEVMYNV